MCGKEPQRSTSKLGQSCHEKSVENRKKLKEQRVKDGMCGQCLVRPPQEGRKLCGGCHEKKQLDPARRLNKRCLVYGIDSSQYKEMLEAQGGRCAICGSGPKGRWGQLDIDHCHKTGKVRGLLCHECNKGMGCLGDDPDRVAAAEKYLRSSLDE